MGLYSGELIFGGRVCSEGILCPANLVINMFTAEPVSPYWNYQFINFWGTAFFYRNILNLADLQIFLTSACYFSNPIPLPPPSPGLIFGCDAYIRGAYIRRCSCAPGIAGLYWGAYIRIYSLFTIILPMA